MRSNDEDLHRSRVSLAAAAIHVLVGQKLGRKCRTNHESLPSAECFMTTSLITNRSFVRRRRRSVGVYPSHLPKEGELRFVARSVFAPSIDSGMR